MEKININHLELKDVAEKLNELVDFANEIIKWRIEELEKDINLITYGARITDKQKLEDMQFRANQQDCLSKIMKEYCNGKET